MTEAATSEKVAAEVKPSAAKAAKSEKSVKLIRAVYGPMVDPHTGERFDIQPREAPEVTGWVASQIEAKKLELL